MWQDIVMMIVIIVFSLSLVPQIYEGYKQKKGFITLATSLPTFLGLYVLTFCYYTLSLYFAAGTSFLTGTLWFILFVQKIMYKG